MAEKDIKPKKIRLATDLTWDTPMYVKMDPDQEEYRLSGVIIRPGEGVQFMLMDMVGNESILWDHLCSTVPDVLKKMGEPGRAKDDEDEE